MLYHDPKTIYSPKDFIEKVDVIYDGGEESFSLARIVWEGNECVGLRWNVARREWDNVEKFSERQLCVGMPSSHGYPAWFILPDEIVDHFEKKDFPSIETLLEALKDCDNSVTHIPLAPGQKGIGALTTSRSSGLKEIRDFTRDANELIIIDPYIFGEQNNNSATYLDEFKRSSRINGNSLKKIHFIYNPGKVTNQVKQGLKNLASEHNCTVSAFATDKIHDRIWIKDRTEAIMVGTSFGGIGNKLCFITYLQDDDLNDLLMFIEEEKMLTSTFA